MLHHARSVPRDLSCEKRQQTHSVPSENNTTHRYRPINVAMAKLAGSLALEVTEKETAGSPLASNIPCWILSQCLNKKSSLLELRKDAMSLSLDCSVAEVISLLILPLLCLLDSLL